MGSNRQTSSDLGICAWLRFARRLIPHCLLAGLSMVLLISCASANAVGVKNTTRHAATATPANKTPIPAQLTRKYGFTVQDSGKTLTYTVTSRFGITLNSQQYPKSHLQVLCNPQDTLGSISNIPSVVPPLYAVRYQGVEPGICTIRNGNFYLIVRIVALITSAPAPCQTRQLRIAFDNNGAAAGNAGAQFVFVNQSQESCTLSGYPAIQLLDARHQPMRAQVMRTTGAYLYITQMPRPFVLQAGEKAYFVVEWGDLGCGNIPPASYASPVSFLRVTPPLNQTSLLIAFQFCPYMEGIEISPLEPGKVLFVFA